MYSAMLFAAMCVPDGHYHRNNVLAVRERAFVPVRERVIRQRFVPVRERVFVPVRSFVTVDVADPFFVSRRTVFDAAVGGFNTLTIADNGRLREFVIRRTGNVLIVK